MGYTNLTGVSLPMAVWLASDNYSGKQGNNPYQISATSLLKSPRQIVLGLRAKPEDEVIDVASVIKSRIGTAIHDAIEKAWMDNPTKLTNTLMTLGYPLDLIEKIELNPTQPTAGSIPVYMELRQYKPVGKWVVTGQFDMVFDGHLHDTKSTGTFTYSKDTKSEDYSMQGSIYRWMNPHLITDDKEMTIDFVFTDWKQSGAAMSSGKYPASQVLSERYPLKPIDETDAWINSRLNLIESLELTDEPNLPECNDTELWRSESVWKYYSSGQIGPRSTKNFDNAADAYAKKNSDGNKGLVVEVKGAPTACLYCNVASACSQKNLFIANGDIVL